MRSLQAAKNGSSTTRSCVVGALAGAMLGALLFARGDSWGIITVAAASGLAPVVLSMKGAGAGGFGWLGETIMGALQSSRALARLDRWLATVFVTGAFLYIQVLADYDINAPMGLSLAIPVAFASLMFGLEYGLGAAALIAAANYFVFVPPEFTLLFDDWRDLRGVAAFTGVAIGYSVICREAFHIGEAHLSRGVH